MAYHMPEEVYRSLRDEYSGICLGCDSIKWGDTEPDAENYECEKCGKSRVQGIENLLVMGLIDIDEQAEPPFVIRINKKTKERSKKLLQF